MDSRSNVEPVMSHRVIVTGSRTWDRPLIVAAVLGQLRDSYGSDLELIHRHSGRGVDEITDRWAEKYDVTVTRWRPRPDEAGPEAEAEADRRIVEYGADACIAFIRVGSWPGCSELAEAAGIRTERYLHHLPYPELFDFEVYDETEKAMV